MFPFVGSLLRKLLIISSSRAVRRVRECWRCQKTYLIAIMPDAYNYRIFNYHSVGCWYARNSEVPLPAPFFVFHFSLASVSSVGIAGTHLMEHLARVSSARHRQPAPSANRSPGVDISFAVSCSWRFSRPRRDLFEVCWIFFRNRWSISRSMARQITRIGS